MFGRDVPDIMLWPKCIMEQDILLTERILTLENVFIYLQIGHVIHYNLQQNNNTNEITEICQFITDKFLSTL